MTLAPSCCLEVRPVSVRDGNNGEFILTVLVRTEDLERPAHIQYKQVRISRVDHRKEKEKHNMPKKSQEHSLGGKKIYTKQTFLKILPASAFSVED